MTIQDARNVIALLQVVYPDRFRSLSDEGLIMTVKLWQQHFADEPGELVMHAVNAFIRTSTDRFAPNIGMIKEQIRKLTKPEQMTEAEAWARISRALSNGIYGSVEEFAKLPPILQQVVGGPSQLREWAQMDIETVQSVVASNLQRSYRSISKREAELSKLPAGMREQMKQLSEKMFGQIGDGSNSHPLLPGGGPRQ